MTAYLKADLLLETRTERRRDLLMPLQEKVTESLVSGKEDCEA